MKLFLSIFLVMFCLPIFSQNSDAKNDTKSEQEVKPVEKKAEAQKTQEGVENFYGNFGFGVLTEKGILPLTFDLRQDYFYDSNVFLNEENEEGDVVYAIDLLANLSLKQEKWSLNAGGGFRYEEYLEEDSLDEFLPKANFNFNYEGEIFYFNVTEFFARSSSPNTAEREDRSPSQSNNFQFMLGARYKETWAELTTFHTYFDYRDIIGDYQKYGQDLRAGYQVQELVSATIRYGWDIFDYRETLFAQGEVVEDTFGQRVLVGARVNIAKKLVATLETGAAFREGRAEGIFDANLTWYVNQKLTLTLTGKRSLEPSLVGNFAVNTNAGVNIRYLITQKMAIQTSGNFTHNNPEAADTSRQYLSDTTLSYRILRGVDIELFYRYQYKDKRARAGDYERHLAGGSLRIGF